MHLFRIFQLLNYPMSERQKIIRFPAIDGIKINRSDPELKLLIEYKDSITCT